jgi:hypothetical protein
MSLVACASSRQEAALEVISKQAQPQDICVRVQEVRVRHVLRQVLEHRPSHVGASVPEEVPGDHPDVAVCRTGHLPVTKSWNGLWGILRLLAAPPDSEDLFDKGAEGVGIAELSEVFRQPPLTDAGRVVIVGRPPDELARPKGPTVAVVEQEPSTKVRPDGQLIDGNSWFLFPGVRVLRDVDRVVDLDRARRESTKITQYR